MLRRHYFVGLLVSSTIVVPFQPSATSGERQMVAPLVAPTYTAVDGDPVDLYTGLYLRNTVDLILTDSIPIVFRRTYRNRDSLSRPFGIGTNHSYGSFLVGDGPISYIDLILPDGGRVHYRRTAGRAGHIGAAFEHTTSPSEYRNSRLFWNGTGWTIQLRDGSVYTYPDCPPALRKPCTVSSYRTAKGQQIRMRHDQRMNLVRIESDQTAIDLTYDTQDRIVLAHSSHDQQVRYEYDPQGRLVRVTNLNGTIASYRYDDRHQMVQIDEPGLSIQNSFDSAGRCVTNDVRTLDEQGRTVIHRELFTFVYTLNAAGKVIATEVERPGNRRKVTFNDQGYALSDTVEAGAPSEFGTTYERDTASNVVQRLTLWCGAGRRVSVETRVDPDSSLETIRRLAQLACTAVTK